MTRLNWAFDTINIYLYTSQAKSDREKTIVKLAANRSFFFFRTMYKQKKKIDF